MDQQNKAKGRNFLKVTGILMIIGGALGLILSIVALAGSGLAAAALGGNIITGLLVFSSVVALLGSVIEFVAGIIGVKNNNKPEKAGTCLVWGIIVAALSVLSAILSLSGGSSFGDVIGSLITGLVIPVLYIIGAALNKKQAQ